MSVVQHSVRQPRFSMSDLFVVLGAMGDRLKDLRDRALLLVGFAEPASDAPSLLQLTSLTSSGFARGSF